MVSSVFFPQPTQSSKWIINEKSDVFRLWGAAARAHNRSGRRAVDSSRQSLVMWAKPLLDTKNMKDLADPRLGDAYDTTGEMKRALFNVHPPPLHHATGHE
ncbi:hypothetical protein SAY87_002238 [Trapa incisa]|uniref:Uncharacterized protein n=1 Tax=Trapa incisa TaxID=236973 RepID=A0AAN7JU45_9MYRT|nr:hypothetical protein SAY87_002238 [Trapa incisa]